MNTFVPRIWAQRKLGYLIDQVRLSPNPAGQTELLDEIIRLSKEYGIITEYTSFLVDEQEQRRLGIYSGGAGDPTQLGGHTPIQRRQVAERAVQYGINGVNVTDQSGRARDLRGSDIAASRYQSANGSVDLYLFSDTTSIGPGGAAQGQAAAGNFKYSGAIGGLGGRPAAGAVAAKPALRANLGTNDAGNAITMQNAGGHTFYKRANSVWVDDSYAAGKQAVIKIQAYSDAHFDLLHRLPELAVCSSVGDHAIMRVNNCAIEIGDEGKTKLTDADLKVIMAR
jgi:Ca-activated chloride channel family protein